MKLSKLLIKIIWLCLISTSVLAAPKKDLWPIWQANNPQSTNTIDNSKYQQFLTKYVVTNSNGINLVKYSQVTQADLQSLQNYIKYMSTIKILSYNRNEQLAYWVNLYNALTLDVVLEHMPVDSILKIKLGGIFSSGPWDAKLITIEGHMVSLNDIEHRIIRPIWHDERTHYILNCASLSCPNLQNIPFTGKTINQRLDAAASSYVNSSRGVQIINGKLVVSQIYDWYADDFGSNGQDVIASIRKFVATKLKLQLQKFNKIDSYTYNWSLNSYQ